MNLIKNSIRRNRTFVQIALLGVLILVLQLPIGWIQGLIFERQQTKQTALQEVSVLVGGNQELIGPFVSLPFTRITTNAHGVQSTVTGRAAVAPDALTIESVTEVEERHRGIFSIPTYKTKLLLTGSFINQKFPLSDKEKPSEIIAASGETTFKSEKVTPKEQITMQFDYTAAVLTVGIRDPKNIREASVLSWNGTTIPFQAGTRSHLASGIHAPITLRETDNPSDVTTFTLSLTLTGSGLLGMSPSGKVSKVIMSSHWPSPSFSGEYLPATREITQAGFKSTWQVSALGREVPDVDLFPSAGGKTSSLLSVSFLSPIDPHRMTERSIKYELLVVFLTFTCFYFFEVFTKILLHPVQYLLVGCALVLFYLMLLSFSEHIGFEWAYFVASLTSIGLVVTYSRSILAEKKRALIVGALLASLYAFFYTLLREEQYALLMGSFGLVLVLGTMMFLSRKVNWYQISEPNPAADLS